METEVVSNDERETLHVILDALLNARGTLERIDPNSLPEGMAYNKGLSERRRELTLNGSRFLRRIIGEELHTAEMSLDFCIGVLNSTPA